MKLFLIEQEQNSAYNAYASAVVAAPDEISAQNINPKSGRPINWTEAPSTWATGPEYVTVHYLGEAADSIWQGALCAALNAG